MGKSVQKVAVPDGVYQGTWGGFAVEIVVDGRKVEFETDIGVKGIDIPVTVTVKDGAATVQTK